MTYEETIRQFMEDIPELLQMAAGDRQSSMNDV
jgi:hypothetical protein